MSSTAAATLRQLVMFLAGDKVIDEDKLSGSIAPTKEIVLPNGVKVNLRPSALDAYHILEDLYLLVNSEYAPYLQLESLSRTFLLELIESVLTNCHQAIRQVILVIQSEATSLIPHLAP